MPERLQTFLMALYPAGFRGRFGEECRQLVRDRLRDERGFLARARLWLELAVDCIAGIPRLHAAEGPVSAVAGERAGSSMFWMEDERPLRPAFVACAGFLSLTAFGSLLLWMALVHCQREAAFSEALMAQPRIVKFHAQGVARGWAESPTDDAPGSRMWSGEPREKHRSRGLGSAGVDTRTTAGLETGGTGTMIFHGRLLRAAIAMDPRGGATGQAAGSRTGEPRVENATRAMVAAFQSHAIVMFGETHANKQEYAWLCELVKDPVFHARVDDIVVEFGNSLYQKSVDRFIAGDDVPLEQVQKAWRNMAGSVGPVSPVYGEFYEAVRESNRKYPEHKLRLLLGDPYADWDKIKDAEDLGPYVSHRDEWYAQVVKDEVLAKHHRALLIMGAGHFRRTNGPGMVERAVRAAGVDPYLVVFGTNVVGSYDDVDPRFDSWKTPAMVALAGNWVGDLPAMPVLTCEGAAPSALKLATAADAMLYVGGRDTLTQVNVPAAELQNSAYGREINRRLMIEMGRTMTFTEPNETPQCQRPAQQRMAAGPIGPPPGMPRSAHDPLPPRPPSQ